MQRVKPPTPPVPDDFTIENVEVPGLGANPPVSLRVYRPRALTEPSPALFWLHGGGYIGGSPEQDERTSIRFARELGITVVAGRYRLAPQHPSPAAVEDAFAGWRAIATDPERFGVDPARIALGGASAGGGLTAGLALYIHDHPDDSAGVRPVFQLLLYPMLDDRTVVRTDMDTRHVRAWTVKSNRFGWTSYLGGPPGAADVSPYAAPARRVDLSGLPPAWIGVGTLDLFHDEDIVYAERLRAAGVECEVLEIPGAFHGFDAVMPKAGVSGEFFDEQVRVLKSVLQAEG